MRSFLRHNRGWFILGFSLLALIIPGIIVRAGEVSVTTGTLWSLLPVGLTVLLMILTRDIFVSLFTGILSAAFLFGQYSLSSSVQVIFAGMEESIGTKDNLCVLVLLILFSALIALTARTEGAAAFARFITRHVKSERTVLLLTTGFSLLFFFDDYYGCVSTGALLRPVTDRYRISHAKIAFILDATAGPLCVLIPLCSWAAIITASTGQSLFLSAIPFCFYSILILLSVLIVVLTGIDIGPMRRSELAAKQGTSALTISDDAEGVSTEVVLTQKRGSIVDFLFPAVSLILACFLCFLCTGRIGGQKRTLEAGSAVTLAEETVLTCALHEGETVTLPAGTQLSLSSEIAVLPEAIGDSGVVDTDGTLLFGDTFLVSDGTERYLAHAGIRLLPAETPKEGVIHFGDALSAASPYVSMALGAAIALVLSILFYTVRGVLSFRECMATLPKGLRTISPLLLLLCFSWLFSYLIGPERLEFGVFFTETLQSGIPAGILPFLFFLLSSILAIATGTAYGTFAVFLPVAAGIAGVPEPIRVLLVAAVLSGAVLGDHASPVSDTTLLASASADCPVLEHVFTQLPYVGICAFCTAVGFLVGGLSGNGLSGLASALGVFALVLLIAIFRIFYRKKHV